jgi:hypothetical protein
VAANKQKSHKESAGHESSRAPKPAAADLREQVFIGTSGWAYPTWKPGFYPHALPQKKFLEYYATQLNSVEVNYTFRQLPTESMLTGWLAASDGGFRFSFKAPQRITHILRLKDCSGSVAALSRALAPVVTAGRFRPISKPTCLASTPSLQTRIRVDCGWLSNFGTSHGFATKSTPR